MKPLAVLPFGTPGRRRCELGLPDPLALGKHPERVFTFRGKPINSANTKAWHAALKRAGIEDFRWHDLRHTWATWQRQAGTPTHELQQLGGWRTGAMVERMPI